MVVNMRSLHLAAETFYQAQLVFSLGVVHFIWKLAMCGDVLGCHSWGGNTGGISWAEADMLLNIPPIQQDSRPTQDLPRCKSLVTRLRHLVRGETLRLISNSQAVLSS